MFHFPQILRNYRVEFTKALRCARLVFNLIMFRRKQEEKKKEKKKNRLKKKKRGKKSLGLLCIGISLVFSCIFFLKAIFPGGCYLHTRQPDGGHYKKDRCRLKYKATVGEGSFIFF